MKSSANLSVSEAKGIRTLRTESGWSLERAAARIVTDRGVSRPGTRDARALGFEHEFHVRRRSRSILEIWQTVRNLRETPLRVREIVQFDGRVALEGRGWRLSHAELFKCEKYFGGYSLYTNGLFAELPGVSGRFGHSEDTPFPGLFYTHPERGTVLISVLSQDRSKPTWTLEPGRGTDGLIARDHFSGIPDIPVQAGGTFRTEKWIVLAVPGGIQEALDAYFRELSSEIRFPGADSPLREAIVWGSWNLNVRPRGHGDIDEAYILANARALAGRVGRKPGWVMIDDGYQYGKSAARTGAWKFCSGIDNFHSGQSSPHDPSLFPRGMKAVARDLLKIGVQPAIWSTSTIDATGSLATAHPDWLIRLSGGRRYADHNRYLDYSLPEVREYTRSAWHTIFREWGYRGLKLDFWTYGFELDEIRYRNRDKTAVELRNLFWQDAREFLPEGGYLLSCCTVNAGNPFLGRYVDSSRMGEDIGSGLWDQVFSAANWLTASSLFYRGDCLLGDPDSFGWNPALTENENRTAASLALVSGAMCEIGGDLTKLSPEAEALLDRAIRFYGPNRASRNSSSGPGIDTLPASRWSLERDDGTYEAVFNWQRYPKEVVLERPVRDFWTGRRVSGTHRIPAHGVLFYKR
jgi:hypothetical protein